jgi:hypothetical protein
LHGSVHKARAGLDGGHFGYQARKHSLGELVLTALFGL